MAVAPRNKTREIAPEIRAKNFEEVNRGFDLETAQLEATRCLNCKNPACRKGCPVGVNIPDFIAKIKEGDLSGAATVIKGENNLPSICGRVCPQESQCENNCVLKKFGAVAIGALERFVGDYALNNPTPTVLPIRNGKRAAIVGSGPAGLSAAADLAKAGFDVTIFEAFHEAGGVLVYGIPEFRLPKSIVKAEINALKELGVKIETNVVIGKTYTFDDLREDYDYIFVASGAGLPTFMNIKGEGLNGVCSANEFLTRVNLMKAMEKDSATPVQRAKNVIVVGAGNVAMDAARTALRLGADKVTIVYRRSRDEMPARQEEIQHAEQEGIEFRLLTNPIEVIGNGKVEGLKCIKMELGEPDERGRRRPMAIEGSEFETECDQLIMALGTSPNPIIKNSAPELETTKHGTIVVDENMKTSIDRIYAGGDATTGAATVILAMSAGRKAAAAIIADESKRG